MRGAEWNRAGECALNQGGGRVVADAGAADEEKWPQLIIIN